MSMFDSLIPGVWNGSVIFTIPSVRSEKCSTENHELARYGHMFSRSREALADIIIPHMGAVYILSIHKP